jgi:hypothetical protein
MRIPLMTSMAAALALLLAGAVLGATVAAKAVGPSSSAETVSLGTIEVTVSLDAGQDAAARTWLFEVVDQHGTVIELLSVGTHGQQLTASVESAPVPFGDYLVRQVLTSDLRTSCEPGAFYAVTAPPAASAIAAVTSPRTTIAFAITVCPVAPLDLALDPPIDDIGGRDPGTIDEVLGVRTGNPAVPAAGSGLERSSSATWAVLVVGGVAAFVSLGLAALSLLRRRGAWSTPSRG